MNDCYRLKFTKSGRAIYLSHLDLMRTMQRVFLRADLPLKYSQGFNPHAQISIPLPLSIGTSSECEVMDFKLIEKLDLSKIPEMLNRTMPEGIEVLEAYKAETKCKNIKWIHVEGRFEYDDGDITEIKTGIENFFSEDSIVIEKRTKRGMKEMDIAHAIKSINFACAERAVTFHAIISALEPTLNPTHLVTALKQLKPDLEPDFAEFNRKQIYDRDMNIFR